MFRSKLWQFFPNLVCELWLWIIWDYIRSIEIFLSSPFSMRHIFVWSQIFNILRLDWSQILCKIAFHHIDLVSDSNDLFDACISVYRYTYVLLCCFVLANSECVCVIDAIQFQFDLWCWISLCSGNMPPESDRQCESDEKVSTMSNKLLWNLTDWLSKHSNCVKIRIMKNLCVLDGRHLAIQMNTMYWWIENGIQVLHASVLSGV